MSDDLRPPATHAHLRCPFCGGPCDPEGWAGFEADGKTIKHGPACDDCGASAPSMEMWNRRDPAAVRIDANDERLVERVAQIIRGEIAKSCVYVGANEPLNCTTIDGHTDLVAAARAALSALGDDAGETVDG